MQGRLHLQMFALCAIQVWSVRESAENIEGICVGSLGKCCSTKCDLNGGLQTKFGYKSNGGSFGKAAAFKMDEVVLKNCEVLKGEVQDYNDKYDHNLYFQDTSNAYVCVEKCQVWGKNGIKMGAGGKKWHVRRAGGDPTKPPSWASSTCQGVKIYDLKYDGAAEAASSLRRHGFVALAALSPALLRRQRRLSAALLRRAARAQPEGNRRLVDQRRYSLGRSTMVPGTLELAQSPGVSRHAWTHLVGVLEVLKAFWGSGCTVQCTGGDASFPGAQQQDLHADVPVKEVADQLYNYFDPENPERTGQGCVPLICPAGTAIIMDMRVWHGGTANKSSTARPMLSVHYAGPDYSEDVLKDGGSIPFFGTCYWSYHRGSLDQRGLESLPATGRELCKHLVADETVSCVNCNTPNLRPGRSALRSIGAQGGPWLCLNCWAAQKSGIMR
eukprot:s905_g28.t1